MFILNTPLAHELGHVEWVTAKGGIDTKMYPSAVPAYPRSALVRGGAVVSPAHHCRWEAWEAWEAREAPAEDAV